MHTIIKMNNFSDINKDELRLMLNEHKNRVIEIFDSIDSTNTELLKMAKAGCPDRTVVIAHKQLSGRGRMGRSFFSPQTGIYFSLCLREDDIFDNDETIDPQSALFLTVIAGIAAADAIRSVYGIDAYIKWTNDILWKNRKLCGILSESAIGANGQPDYIVVGVGINLRKGDYPADIKDKAVSIEEAAEAEGKQFINYNDRCSPEIDIAQSETELIAAFLNHFDMLWDRYLLDGNSDYIISEYKEYMRVIGKKVTVKNVSGAYQATVKDVANDGNLIVEDDNGNILTLNSGEISIDR